MTSSENERQNTDSTFNTFDKAHISTHDRACYKANNKASGKAYDKAHGRAYDRTHERTYICIDLKSFYASVECVERGLDPLKTNLVVADQSRTDKTICLAVSPSLKALGVPGRPRLFEAAQAIREAEIRTGRKIEYIVAPPQMALYLKYSADIFSVYLKYIAPEDIHTYSIDEVFMDVTDYLPLYGLDPHDLAVKMIRDVLKTTGITATVGIGTNMYLAKVAMDIVAKHMPADSDGVRIAALTEEGYRRKLWRHTPLTDFWQIGAGISRRLAAIGVHTMGDIAAMSLSNESFLYDLFGINAELLIDHAWGIEPCTMREIKAYVPCDKSLNSSQVLPRPYAKDQALLIVKEMAELMAMDLTERRYVSNSITMYVNYEHIMSREIPAASDMPLLTDITTPKSVSADGSAKPTGHAGLSSGDLSERIRIDRYNRLVPRHSRGTFSFGTHTNSCQKIIGGAAELFSRIADEKLYIRRISISASNILPEDSSIYQYDLFTDPEKKDAEIRLQRAILAVRRKYGKNSILRGMSLLEGARTMERNSQIGGHRA